LVLGSLCCHSSIQLKHCYFHVRGPHPHVGFWYFLAQLNCSTKLTSTALVPIWKDNLNFLLGYERMLEFFPHGRRQQMALEEDDRGWGGRDTGGPLWLTWLIESPRDIMNA
jgi:hypothetical protein